MLNELNGANKVIGTKQVRRALGHAGKTVKVFLASDADPRVTEPLARLAGERSVPVEMIPSMKELGEVCGIAVGSAAAAVVR